MLLTIFQRNVNINFILFHVLFIYVYIIVIHYNNISVMLVIYYVVLPVFAFSSHTLRPAGENPALLALYVIS